MVPLGYDHLGAGNVPVKGNVFLREQLVQDLRERRLGKVSEDLTSWLPHLCQEPKIRHHRELETWCLLSGRKHGSEAPPGLDRQARKSGYRGVWLHWGSWPVQHALQPHSPLGPTFQPPAIHRKSFFEVFEVRLCLRPCLVDVVSVLISESRHQRDPTALQHRDGLAMCFGYGVDFRFHFRLNLLCCSKPSPPWPSHGCVRTPQPDRYQTCRHCLRESFNCVVKSHEHFTIQNVLNPASPYHVFVNVS